MKSSDYLNHHLRNSMHFGIGRSLYIPEHLWPIFPKFGIRYNQVIFTPEPKRKCILCLKEYKRIINRPKSSKSIKRQLRKLSHKTYSVIDKEIKGVIFQKSHEDLKWQFVDIPNPFKEYFKELERYSKQIVISTDMPSRTENTFDLGDNRVMLEQWKELTDKPIIGIINFANGTSITIKEPTPNE